MWGNIKGVHLERPHAFLLCSIEIDDVAREVAEGRLPRGGDFAEGGEIDSIAEGETQFALLRVDHLVVKAGKIASFIRHFASRTTHLRQFLRLQAHQPLGVGD